MHIPPGCSFASARPGLWLLSAGPRKCHRLTERFISAPKTPDHDMSSFKSQLVLQLPTSAFDGFDDMIGLRKIIGARYDRKNVA